MEPETLLTDAEFWADVRASMSLVMIPLFRDAFEAGAKLAITERPRKRKEHECEDCHHTKEIAVAAPDSYDVDAINSAADRYIAEYMDSWWAQFSETTRERMRAAFQLARTNGLQPKEVAKMLEPLFGAARAKVIAITEMTRLLGAGAQEQYRLTGWTDWEWRTVNDSRVDTVCEGRDGQQFPMSVPFEPAHVACRCFIVPAGDIV